MVMTSLRPTPLIVPCLSEAVMGNRAQVLIPGSAEYVTLNGKMDFTDVIKGHIWRWENYSDPPSGSHRIARALNIGRGRQGSESERWQRGGSRCQDREPRWEGGLEEVRPAPCCHPIRRWDLSPPASRNWFMPTPEWARERNSRKELSLLTPGL